MKKIIISLVATILLLFTLSSCKKQETSNPQNDESDNTVKSIESAYIDDLGNLIIKYTSNETENLGKVACDNVWRERNDTVYLTGDLTAYNEDPIESPNYSKTYLIKFKTAVKRTGTNGTWNRIIVNNKTYYIDANYTTTNKAEIIFDYSQNKKVYTTENTKLYNFPNEENLSPRSLDKNLEITQLAINETNTWIEVKYENHIYYCKPDTVKDNRTTEIPTVVN
ncbi:MAG: hypothetical protein IKA76_08975 [Clostridia bacterium]|nr:hypothetical protein [Clostridia bacterium]